MANGIPGLGHQSYVQIFPEATYGTRAATNGKRFESLSIDLHPSVAVIEDGSLNNNVSRRALYQGATQVSGTIRVRANYEGLEELLRGVFGGYSRILVGGETVVWDHTFLEASALKSYSIELIEGNIPATQCQVVLGAKITRMTFSIAAGQGEDAMGIIEFEFTGRDKMTGATPTGALSAPTVFPVLFHHMASASTDGVTAGADFYPKSVEITIQNALATDRFILGDRLPKEPIRNNFLEVTWRWGMEFQSVALEAALLAFTNLAPRLLLQDPTTIGTSSKREFDFTAPKTVCTEYSNPIDDYGIVDVNASMRSYYDSGIGAAIKVEIRNGLAALT